MIRQSFASFFLLFGAVTMRIAGFCPTSQEPIILYHCQPVRSPSTDLVENSELQNHEKCRFTHDFTGCAGSGFTPESLILCFSRSAQQILLTRVSFLANAFSDFTLALPVNNMDEPLFKLSEASGISINEDHEWPEGVDTDVKEFLQNQAPSSLFVVEQADGLVIGPPPQAVRADLSSLERSADLDTHVLAIVKRSGVVEPENWERKVVTVSMPLQEGTVFQHLHALVSQACIPLFDSVRGSAAANARHRFVETERALASLLANAEVPMVDITSEVSAAEVRTAFSTNNLNLLQATANSWRQQISDLAATDRDPLQSTASDEVAFWIALREALVGARRQLESPIVQEVVKELEKHKRFQATQDLLVETGLQSALNKAETVTQILLKDLPLGELLAAGDFEQLDLAVQDIFDHFQKRLRTSSYGAKRGVALVEVIGKDFSKALAKLTNSAVELLVDRYSQAMRDNETRSDQLVEFTIEAIQSLKSGTERVYARCQDVCETWDTGVRDFLSLTRDLMRKNQERYTVVRVQPSHTGVMSRLASFNGLVSQHAELFPLVSTPELAFAFDAFIESQPFLALSDSEWKNLQGHYSKVAYDAETNIANDLKARLEATEGNTSLLFTVFEEHKLVLTRARVRAVSHPFQARLLSQTREDLKQATQLLHQLPSVAEDIVGRVVLIRQIRLRLDQLRERLSTILGVDWRQHAEGAQIAGDLDAFDTQLDVDADVRKWSENYVPGNLQDPEAPGQHSTRIVCGPGTDSPIVTTKSGDLIVKGRLPPKPQEARSLQALGFWLPPPVHASIDKISRFYGKFKELQMSLCTLNSICAALESNPRVSHALDVMSLGKNVINFVIAALTTVTWASPDLESFIDGFTRACNTLDQRVLHLSLTDAAVNQVLSCTLDVRSKKKQVSSLLMKIVAPGYTEKVNEDLDVVIQSELAILVSKHRPRPVDVRIEMSPRGIEVVPQIDDLLEIWFDEINSFVFEDLLFDSLSMLPELSMAYAVAIQRVWSDYNALNIAVEPWIKANWLFDTSYAEFKAVLLETDSDSDLGFEKLATRLKGLLADFDSLSAANDLSITCRKEVKEKYQQWIILLRDDLVAMLAAIIDPRMNNIRKISKDLGSRKFDTQHSETLVATLACLQCAICALQESKATLRLLRDVPTVLGESSEYSLFVNAVSALEALCQDRVSEKDRIRADLSKALEHDAAKLFGEFKLYESSWTRNKPLNPKCVPKDALKLLTAAKEQLEEFAQQCGVLKTAFQCLPSTLPSSLQAANTKIGSLLEESNSLAKGYEILGHKFDCLKQILNLPFFDTKFDEIRDSVLSLDTKDVPELASQLEAYKQFCSETQSLIDLLPIVELLKSSSSWDVSHMEALLGKTGTNSGPFLLKHLKVASLSLAAVREAIELSEGEDQLREYLNNINSRWQQSQMSVRNAIVDLDSYLQLAIDNLAGLDAMRSSRHFSQVSVVVRQMQGQLEFARQIFEQLIDSQQLYLQLRSLLLSPRLETVLPAEVRQFGILESQFRDVFLKADNAHPLEFVASPRLAETLAFLANELEQLHRSLAGFLEQQRDLCPRLSFVGDDDVLEIVSTSIEVWGPKMLSLLFPGVQFLVKENDATYAVSKEGEKIGIDFVIENSADSPGAINLLEQSLRSALKREIRKACAYFNQEYTWAGFSDFLKSTPMQACLVGLRVYRSHHPNSDLFAELLPLVPRVGSGEDSVRWSRLREALAVELSQFVASTRIDIRFSFDQELEIWMGPHSFAYGYEYLGCPESAVRTKVTEDLFLSAGIALAQCSGLSIAGPAGTGKTESVKAMGNLLGRRVVVFNCDDEFDTTFVARAVHGSAKTRCWVCFDEFNRLPRQVLSGIAPLLARKVHDTPVFVTMNPGYAGRSVLPPNMRAQFREFWLTKPDAYEIARVLLASQGRAADAAKRVVALLAELNQQLEPQQHYDWGLRTLKTVLKAMSTLSIDSEQACESVIRPRLLPADRVVFDRTMQSARSDHNNVQDMIRLLSLTPGHIILGPPRSGKSTLIRAVAEQAGADIVTCDPSAMKKHALIGFMEPSTREWADGLITRTLRKAIAIGRQNQEKMLFLVFDGEVESQFAEALNSVLDETRQLTLPTGELLSVPQSVKFIFETTNLNGATLATISRCSVLCTERRQTHTTPVEQELSNLAPQIPHMFPFSVRDSIVDIDLGSEPMSLAWKYAGDSDATGRSQVTEVIRKFHPEIPSRDGENLTSYRCTDGRYSLWKAETLNLPRDAMEQAEVVVPTFETRANEYVLAEALKQDVPLLLVGPPGSGKTMTLLNALRNSPELELVALSLGVQSGPELIIQALEMQCEYTLIGKKKVLMPPGNKKLALFLDELNLPEPNEYGNSPILQLLRSMIERKGFHDSMGDFVTIERIQLIGACNPPPERLPLPPRFIPLWFVVSVNYPTRESLLTIYRSYLKSFGAASCCVPMVEVYEQLRRDMPDEIWTPRELTRWTRGLYGSMKHLTLPDDSLLARLFYYEGERVLADKLSAAKFARVGAILKAHSTTIHPVSIHRGDIWTPLVTRNPQFVSLEKLGLFLQSRLEVYAEEAAYVPDQHLIAHEDFMVHVSRIIRVLRQPQGHLLLRGAPATGKKAAVRFSCWLCGINLYRINGHAQYTEDDFASDLRSNVIQSLRGPSVIIMNDSLLRRNAFVERMNALLANGEAPALFSTPEQLKKLEEVAKGCGCSALKTDDLNFWVRQQVVNNLHAVFITESEHLSNLSPALLNRCTINCVQPWTQETRIRIAEHWCQTTDLDRHLVCKVVELPFKSGSRFVELCRQMAQQYSISKQALELRQRRLVAGSDCLKLTVLETKQLEKTLSAQRSQLEVETTHSSEVLTNMLQRQSEAERKRASAVELRSAVQRQKAEIESRQLEADKNLATARPFIKQAKEGVQNIRKAQLNELRAMNNPPEVVKMTLEAVCLVLSLKTDGTWRQVLAQVRGDEFIPRIVNFDSTKLDPLMVRIIKSEYMSRSDFTYERVDRASKAAGPLLRWVVAQLYYADALAAVAPLQEELQRLAEKSEASNHQLEGLENVLRELESSIESCKIEYSKAVAHCESLKAEMQANTTQLTRSQTLLARLSGEQDRWQKAAADFDSLLTAIPKTSFLAAAQLALCGPMDFQQRGQLVQHVSKLVGLSKDSAPHLVSNDEIVFSSFSSVLIVDPSGGQLDNLLTPRDGELSITTSVSSFMLDQEKLLKQVDAAIRFGQHLIVQHAERFDPVLMPLILTEFTKKGTRVVVQVKDSIVDVSPSFKLTLYTRDRHGLNAHFPSLLSLMSVVDYTITPGAFQHMVGDALIRSTMPELAERRSKLQIQDVETRARIDSLESELLESLSRHMRVGSGTRSSLLDDVNLAKQLEVIKTEAERLSEAQSATTATLADLETAFNEHLQDAVDASAIYEKVSRLPDVNNFYMMSAEALWHLAETCAAKSSASEEYTTQTGFLDLFRTETARRIAAMMKRKDRESFPEYSSVDPLPLLKVIEDSQPTTPVLAGLATVNTDDPGPAVLNSYSGPCTVLAAGEGTNLDKGFTKAFTEAVESGSCLIVQNVEIATDEWLKSLSRKLGSSKPNKRFRLVLTGLLDEVKEIPDLVATSVPVCIERETGVKIGLLSSLKSVRAKSPIDFCVAYVHACLAELFQDALFGSADLSAAIFVSRFWDTTILGDMLARAVYGPRSNPETVRRLVSEAMNVFTNMSIDECEDYVQELPSGETWFPSCV